MLEGSGSIPLTNGSGSGWPKKSSGYGGSGTQVKSVANLDTPLLYEDGVGGGARAVEHPHSPSHRHGYGGLWQPVGGWSALHLKTSTNLTSCNAHMDEVKAYRINGYQH
jgi:hypothetical protein